MNLAADLSSHGWIVDVLAPHAQGASRFEEMAGLKVTRFRYWYPITGETVCYDGGALLQLRANPRNAFKLPALVLSELASCYSIIRKGDYDLVNSHWLLPQGWTAGIASRIRGVPHIATVHGGDVFTLTSPTLSAFKRSALRSSAAVTVNSSATAEVVRMLDEHVPMYTIPMGASFSDPNPRSVRQIRNGARSGEGPLIVFVGRLIEEKGVGDLLASLAILKGRRPQATAILVGDGPYRSTLERQARLLGIADSINFAGWLDSQGVADHLAAGDVFVGPSKRSSQGWVEAFGLTFVEAALAGTPIVATRTGGIVDIVRDGHTGLTVPEDNPEAIAAAVLRLSDDRNLVRILTENARKHVQSNFTREASARAFAGLFDATVSRN